MSMAEENRIAQLERAVADLSLRVRRLELQAFPSAVSTIDVVQSAPFPIKRGPGRPPNPPKDAA